MTNLLPRPKNLDTFLKFEVDFEALNLTWYMYDIDRQNIYNLAKIRVFILKNALAMAVFLAIFTKIWCFLKIDVDF